MSSRAVRKVYEPALTQVVNELNQLQTASWRCAELSRGSRRLDQDVRRHPARATEL